MIVVSIVKSDLSWTFLTLLFFIEVATVDSTILVSNLTCPTLPFDGVIVGSTDSAFVGVLEGDTDGNMLDGDSVGWELLDVGALVGDEDGFEDVGAVDVVGILQYCHLSNSP